MLFITDFLNLAAEEEREETCGHKSNRKWPNFADEERSWEGDLLARVQKKDTNSATAVGVGRPITPIVGGARDPREDTFGGARRLRGAGPQRWRYTVTTRSCGSANTHDNT